MTNIKERVLLIANNQEVSKEEFFENLGLKYGNFKGKAKDTSLSSDAVANILTMYPDINPVWLLTGEGEMTSGGRYKPYGDINDNIVQERFQEVLKSIGLPKEEISKRLGYNLKNGLKMLSPGKADAMTINKISYEFDVNQGWIYSGQGEMFGDVVTQKQERGKRIKAIREASGLTEDEFLEILDNPNPYAVSLLENGILDISESELDNLGLYLNISEEWLMDGVGEMTLPTPRIHNAADRMKLETRKINSYSFNKTNTTVDLGLGKVLYLIPKVTVASQSDFIAKFHDNDYLARLEKHVYYMDGYIPTFGEKSIAFVMGDKSMEDGSSTSILSGDILICIPIDQSQYDTMLDKQRLVIAIHTDGILVREVNEYHSENKTIILKSKNKNKSFYPDFEIQLSDLKKLFAVYKYERVVF